MQPTPITTETPPGERSSRIYRSLLFTIVLGVAAAASILVLIFQVNRSLDTRIQAAEVWADYQVKIVKASSEEDPNLREQYTEEQELLRRDAQALKQSSSNARHVVKLSGYAAVLLLFGTAISIIGLLAQSRSTVYLGLLFGIIGIGFSITTLI